MQTTFSSMSRGYHFTAPANFTICGLYIPDDASTGLQSVEVVRFTAGAPPAFSATTNSFVSLFYQSYWPTNTMIPCNIQVNAGDIIGVYGCRGTNSTNSYGMAQCQTTILGNNVTLYRSGMQFNLATQQMHDIWSEVNYYVGRIFMYINCCPTADFTVTTPICLGDTSTVTYTGSGIPPSATFSWSFPGGTPATANTIGPHQVTWPTPGNYTATLQVSQASCTTVSSSQTITVNALPNANAGPDVDICIGNTANLTATGGTSYSWSNGVNTASNTVSPNVTSTYTVTVYDNGCSATDQLTVTVHPNPVITATANPTSICVGSNATVSATSSVGGTTYSWNQGLGVGASHTVSPTTTTTYTVTGTSAAGCSGTADVQLTVNPTPVLTPSATSQTICQGNNTTISVSSNQAGTTYTWNQGLGAGANHTVSPTTTTTYTVTGTTGSGCTATADITITVNPNPTITATANPTSICLGSNSIVSATSSVGGTTYSWNQGLGAGQSHTVSPTVNTTYTVTGTSAAGCTGTSNITVTVNPNPVITATANPTSICVGSNATVSATSSVGGTTYSWNQGLGTGQSHTVSPITTTTYIVTGTSAAGCSGTADVQLTVNPTPVLTPSATSQNICQGNNTTISVSSNQAGTTYTWNQGLGAGANHTVSPTTTTTYTVTGTTGSGCTATADITITVNPNPTITATANPTSICVGSNSIISATSSVGGTSYSWNQGLGTGQSHTVSPTTTTTYTVTGTSAAGCTGIDTVTVTVNPNLSPTITANPSPICAGDSSVLTVANIPATSSFAWSTGDISNPITVSPANTTTYQVTATDISGCTGTADIQVIVNPLPQISVTNDTVCDGDYGSLLASGGDSYLWDNGSTQNPLSDNPTQTTTYIVTGTDINGCSNTAQGEIFVVPNPQLQILSIDAHCDQNDGSVEVIATGGTGVYTYEWNTIPPATTAVVDNLYPGTYTVTVSDNGCESTASVVVGNLAGPMAAFSLSPTQAEINENIQFTDASIGAISWDWDFGDGNYGNGIDPVHSYSSSGNYEVCLYVEDDYGCRDSCCNRVIINSLFTFYIPNAFSPDGNARNEIFLPQGTGVDAEKYLMQIYDRWGKMIFETTNINEGWDGSINGVLLDDSDRVSEIFIYYIKVFEEGTEISYEYRGTITIVK
jgi:gliding motility-associated-like protein